MRIHHGLAAQVNQTHMSQAIGRPMSVEEGHAHAHVARDEGDTSSRYDVSQNQPFHELHVFHHFRLPMWPIYFFGSIFKRGVANSHEALYVYQVSELHNMQELQLPVVHEYNHITIVSQPPGCLEPVSNLQFPISIMKHLDTASANGLFHFDFECLAAEIRKQQQLEGLPAYAVANMALLKDSILASLSLDAMKWAERPGTPTACLLNMVNDDHMLPHSRMMIGFCVNILYTIALRSGIMQPATNNPPCFIGVPNNMLPSVIPVAVLIQLDVVLYRLLAEFQRRFDEFWHEITVVRPCRKADWDLLFCSITSFAQLYSVILDNLLSQAENDASALYTYINVHNDVEAVMSSMVSSFLQWRGRFKDGDFIMFRRAMTESLISRARSHDSELGGPDMFYWVDLLLNHTVKECPMRPSMTRQEAMARIGK
ncbi:hypothetical protein HOO65_040438 [Ceratocystis lukuohia]